MTVTKKGYSAVFGYDSSSGSSETIPVGRDNAVEPFSLNGEQPTSFLPGAHPAAWVSGTVRLDQPITWTLRSTYGTELRVTATPSSQSCGNGGVSLPAAGNGMGVPIGLAISLPVGAAVVLAERRARRKHHSGDASS